MCQLRGGARARAGACTAKKEARQLAWRWKSPPRRRRERGAATPEASEHETSVAQEEAGEAEVETRTEPGSEEVEEQGLGGVDQSFVHFFFCVCSGFLSSLFCGHGGKEIR